MVRLAPTAGLITACLLFPTAALAADTMPDQTPATKLMRTGLAGSGNELKTSPTVAIMAGDLSVALNKMTLDAVAAKLGGTVHAATADDGAFAWTCYVSPANGAAPAEVIWFASGEKASGKTPVVQVAAEIAPATPPASCKMLSAPLALKTGVPGVGATQADLDAAFGKGDVDPDGTSAWMFGQEKAGDGINLRRHELKYHVANGKVDAASVSIIYEPE